MTAEDRRVARERAARQILVASELGARILHYDSPEYPVNVKESNNPVPVLYARGNVGILRNRRVVACVGSREIREPYISLQRDFADFACRAGFAIASGFALGADSTAHRAAFEANGATICVLPCGVDLSFPPENKDLHDQLLRSQNAVFISEFGMGIRAGRLTLQKRNKLIVATSRGVLVGQTSDKGGAMNAFRAGVEQRKSVTTFAPDGTPATNGNLKIAEEHKVHTIAFPATPSPKAWKSWLAELS
jgi:DNA processing protein